MISDDDKKRPNVNYTLSKQEGDSAFYGKESEQLKFHYNRQERLEKAPASVKRLYETPKHRFNLLRPLIADRPRATIFFTIVGLCIIILILSLMGFMTNTHSLEGNRLQINAVVIEEVTLVTIVKTAKGKDAYSGEIDIWVSNDIVTDENEGEEKPVFRHQIFFTLNETERYSFSVPFASERLDMIFYTEKSQLKVNVKVF